MYQYLFLKKCGKIIIIHIICYLCLEDTFYHYITADILNERGQIGFTPKMVSNTLETYKRQNDWAVCTSHGTPD